MPVAEAHVRTPRASRFLVQLCRHAEAMSGNAQHLHGSAGQELPEVLRAECSDTEGSIEFTWGSCVLQSTSDTLTVRLDVTDEARLGRLKGLLAADLERFGRRDELKVTWQDAGSPVIKEGEAPFRVKRGTTIALIAAVTLTVAVHVVVGGAALASWQWTSVAADVLLAVVVLKIAAVAVFARRRIRGHRMPGLATHLRWRRRGASANQESIVSSQAHFPTSRAERYAEQLCGHAAAKTPRAEWTPPEGVIEFPGTMGTCRMAAESEQLVLSLEATDPANLDRMQEILGRLIARFARQEDPEVTWERTR